MTQAIDDVNLGRHKGHREERSSMRELRGIVSD